MDVVNSLQIFGTLHTTLSAFKRKATVSHCHTDIRFKEYIDSRVLSALIMDSNLGEVLLHTNSDV